MADPTVFVFDVEGTLTDKSGRFIDEDVLAALRGLRYAGNHVLFCSGRDVAYLVAKINEWRLPVTDFVAENGCVIVAGGKEILAYEAASFPRQQIHKRIEKSDIIERGELDPAKKHMLTIYPKGFLEGKDYTADDIQDLLKKTTNVLKGYDMAITHSSASVDLMPAGIDKGAGLKRYVEEAGLDPATLLFAGDGVNDVPAARYVKDVGGTVAAPANAAQMLKDLADYASEKENGAGVLDILHRYTDAKPYHLLADE